MLLKRGQLRTKLDLMKPDVRKRVEGYQEKQIERNKERRMRTFDIGNKVIVRDYRRGKKWKQGVVVTKHSPYSFEIQTADGQCRRHLDQMRTGNIIENNEMTLNDNLVIPEFSESQHENDITLEQLRSPLPVSTNNFNDMGQSTSTMCNNETVIPVTPNPNSPSRIQDHSRPRRLTKPPARLIEEMR